MSITVFDMSIGIIDIAAVAVLAAAAFCGGRRGFMRSLISLLSAAAAIIAAYLLCPIVTDVLMGTSLSHSINSRILSRISAFGLNPAELPKIVQDAAAGGMSAFTDGAAGALTKAVMGITAFIIVYFAIRTIVGICSKILIKTTKLPIIGTADRILGMAAGVIKWGFLTYIILLGLTAAAVPGGDSVLDRAVSESVLCGRIGESGFLRTWLGIG